VTASFNTFESKEKSMNVEVAKIILEQIGGRKFLVMTGAKNLMAIDNGLQFDLPRFPGLAINRVRVILTPADYYRVEFWSIKNRGMKCELVKECEEVYCFNLAEVFESVTGLAVSL
jgi:SH3-like domain-containing protein